MVSLQRSFFGGTLPTEVVGAWSAMVDQVGSQAHRQVLEAYRERLSRV